MEIAFDFKGEIVERQELLNGTETITIEGASADGAWSLTVCFSRNRGLIELAAEGDITLIHEGAGIELWGSLARVIEAPREQTDWVAETAFEVDGGAAAGAGAKGRVNVHLEAVADSVLGRVELDLKRT